MRSPTWRAPEISPAIFFSPGQTHTLAVFGDTDLPAILEDGTHRALRKPSGTNVLSERHEQSIDLDPVLAREFFFQQPPCRLRRRRSHETPPVGDSVDVNVHTDLGCTARDTERQVRALRPNSFEGSHYLEITRQLATVFCNHTSREISDVVCFCLVETRRPNQLGDFLHVEATHGLGGRRCPE